MFPIDEIAYSSPFRDWPPLGKFMLALSLLAASLVAASVIVPSAIFFIGFTLLFYSTKMRFPRIIALVLLEGVGIILLGAIVVALVTGGEALWTVNLWGLTLVFSKQGVDLGMLVFMRALAGITVMLWFATSTPIPYLANALRQVRIPKELVELTVLIYRYSFLLLEQLDTMYVAAQSRLGFRGVKNKFRTSAKLSVGVFTRSLDMAERAQVALDCRSYRGEFHCYRPPAKITAKWVILSVLVFASFYLMNLILTDPSVISSIA